MVKQAFNMMIALQGRVMTVTRKGSPDVSASAKFAPSNYSRNLEGPSDTVIPGMEFVVTKDSLEAVSFPIPLKRGDRLLDSDLKTMVISEVREMFDVGGEIIGYRVRTS